jgi:hypothetical protein
MRYEIEALHDGSWSKIQWCADHGAELPAVRRAVFSLQGFLKRSVRIVAIKADGSKEVAHSEGFN